MSVDARITLGPGRLLVDRDNDRLWASLLPPGAIKLVRERTAQLELSYGPEAVLEGSGTFVADTSPSGPLPESDDADLREDHLPVEVIERLEHRRWFAVIDSRGRCRWAFSSSGDMDLLVLVSETTPLAYLAYLRRERICYVVVGAQRVDLHRALERLGSLGVSCVIADAGGRLNAALIAADLVDEIHVVLAPIIIGGSTTPSIVDGEPLAESGGALRLRHISSRSEPDGSLWLAYEVAGRHPGADRHLPPRHDHS